MSEESQNVKFIYLILTFIYRTDKNDNTQKEKKKNFNIQKKFPNVLLPQKKNIMDQNNKFPHMQNDQLYISYTFYKCEKKNKINVTFLYFFKLNET